MHQQASGMPEERHAVALDECTGLWLLFNPAPHRPGLCAHCGNALRPPKSSVNGAPIRADGAWVHWSCLPWYCGARWEAARAALQRLGIVPNAF
jgi:hypothetical protein